MTSFNLMEAAWDYAFVLDACRFDSFERVWKRYFRQGDLVKACSLGSSTLEWRDCTFTDYYDDVIYVSSNPYITFNRRVHGFVGNEHFREVRDVWLHGWDHQRGTVLPGTVTEASRQVLASNAGARLIVHYLQPHAPYLSLGEDSVGFPEPSPETGLLLGGLRHAARTTGAAMAGVKLLSAVLRRVGLGGTPPEWKVREWFGMEPASPMDAVRRLYGDDGLRRAYESNLALVLDQVRSLLPDLSGRIIITADHGELLGEGGRYSHYSGSSEPRLLEIPLLVIEKGPFRKHRPSGAVAKEEKRDVTREPLPAKDDGSVGDRLKALGYLD